MQVALLPLQHLARQIACLSVSSAIARNYPRPLLQTPNGRSALAQMVRSLALLGNDNIARNLQTILLSLARRYGMVGPETSNNLVFARMYSGHTRGDYDYLSGGKDQYMHFFILLDSLIEDDFSKLQFNFQLHLSQLSGMLLAIREYADNFEPDEKRFVGYS